MTWSTPERCQAEVLLTVCGAIVVSGLGRVATAHQIAPWSEDLTCLSHDAVGAAFRSTSAECFSHFQSDLDVAQRHKLDGRTQQKVLSAASCRAGHGHGPVELWTCKTLARRALPKVNDSISADRHVEKTSPIVYLWSNLHSYFIVQLSL